MRRGRRDAERSRNTSSPRSAKADEARKDLGTLRSRGMRGGRSETRKIPRSRGCAEDGRDAERSRNTSLTRMRRGRTRPRRISEYFAHADTPRADEARKDLGALRSRRCAEDGRDAERFRNTSLTRIRQGGRDGERSPDTSCRRMRGRQTIRGKIFGHFVYAALPRTDKSRSKACQGFCVWG